MSEANDAASGMTPARPAATVIVARETDAGLEVLLLERSTVGAFAGMWVFPGGRVDDDDAGHDELSRAASAAVREAREEVSLDVDPASLIPLAHWTPPAITPKRYTTWFFVAPWSGQEHTIDAHEIVGAQWLLASAALAAGLPIAPPTHVTLETLASVPTFEALRALIDARGIERFVTLPTSHEGSMVLLWEPDAGYATADPTSVGPRHRLIVREGEPNRYERSHP